MTTPDTLAQQLRDSLSRGRFGWEEDGLIGRVALRLDEQDARIAELERDNVKWCELDKVTQRAFSREWERAEAAERQLATVAQETIERCAKESERYLQSLLNIKYLPKSIRALAPRAK